MRDAQVLKHSCATDHTKQERFDMAEIKLAHVGRFFKLILKRPQGRKNSFLTLNMEWDR